MPPDTVILIEPFGFPQVVLVTVLENEMAGGCVTVAEIDAVQPPEAVTVTV